jgi:hypothetical protein
VPWMCQPPGGLAANVVLLTSLRIHGVYHSAIAAL